MWYHCLRLEMDGPMFIYDQETMVEHTWGWGRTVENTCDRQKGREVLILAQRGPLRTSLQSLLLAAPWLETVSLAQDVLPALQIIAQHRPALVIVLDALPGGVEAVLRWIRTEGSHSRSLVLVRDSEQRRDALEHGADMALLRGFPAARLYQVIEQMVVQRDEAGTLEKNGD